jgi:hypothetical protein
VSPHAQPGTPKAEGGLLSFIRKPAPQPPSLRQHRPRAAMQTLKSSGSWMSPGNGLKNFGGNEMKVADVLKYIQSPLGSSGPPDTTKAKDLRAALMNVAGSGRGTL